MMTPHALLKKAQEELAKLAQAAARTAKDKPKPLGLAAAGLAALILWWIFAVPLGEIRRLQAELIPLRAEVAQAGEDVARARQMNRAALPTADRLADFLEDLNALAREQEVQLVKTAPQAARSAGTPGLAILPMELQVQAEYRNLGEFLGALRGAVNLGVVSVRRVAIGREERLLPRLTASVAIEIVLGEASSGS